MTIRNNMGPRTLPWGTPALTGRGDERVPLRAIRWQREWRKSVIQEWSWPSIPKADSLENKAGCQTVSKARDMSRESAMILCLILRASTIVRRIEAACPRWSDQVWIRIDDPRWEFWRKELILCQLRWWIPWFCWWLEVQKANWAVVKGIRFCNFFM